MKTVIQPTGHELDFVTGHFKTDPFKGVSFPLGYSMYCMQSPPARYANGLSKICCQSIRQSLSLYIIHSIH